MAFQPAVGKNMKFYRNTATHATPTWVLISQIGDLNVSDLTRGLAELKRRGNGFVKNLPVFINSIAVEFRLIFGLDTTNYTFLRQTFFSGACVQYAIMNDIIAGPGSEGLMLPAIVEQFPWNQNLEDVSAHDVR